ncbi:MAG: glycosyltransferase family 2 protein [bacterium]
MEKEINKKDTVILSEKSNQPRISVIIPCRNEEDFIGSCLKSILANDYPKDKLEVLVVDGISEDRTRKTVEDIAVGFPYLKILENPKKITPVALNIGIKSASGEIVMKMDAHTIYESDYISKCVFYLDKYQADNVGGVLVTLPIKNTREAKAVAFCLSHRFGSGNSYFRTGTKKPRWVDTVTFGCFKKEIFRKIGFYDENMVRSQDSEFNHRIKKVGGRILLVPDIVAYYYPKSTFKEFFWHNFADGVWLTYPLKFGKIVFSWRHLVPVGFVLCLSSLLILGFFEKAFLLGFSFVLSLYLLASLFFAFKISLREKEINYIYLMPISFTVRHFGYGLGSLWGIIKIFI